MEIGKAHIDRAPPPLSRFIHVPPAFEQLVMSALQKDPAQRPRDAFTFASGLRAVMKKGPSDNTVEQLDIMPVSAARPPIPFDRDVLATPLEVVPPSGGITRVDAPAGMVASTASMGHVTHTVSLGVLPLEAAPQQTVAEAPVTAAMEPLPYVVDRRAETREAIPQALPAPNNDTAPIPLAVLAKAEVAPTGTFGPHTTEPSQRRKTAQVGIAVAAAALSLLAIATIVTGLVMKLHQSPAPSEAKTSPSDLAPEPPPVAASVVMSIVTQPAPEPTPTQVETVEAPPAVTVRHAAAAASHAHTAAVSPPPPASTTVPLRHRVGSGLD
jgi:hypothetical protein